VPPWTTSTESAPVAVAAGVGELELDRVGGADERRLLSPAQLGLEAAHLLGDVGAGRPGPDRQERGQEGGEGDAPRSPHP